VLGLVAILFELFEIGQNFGAIQTGRTQNLDRVGKIATCDQATHGPRGNIPEFHGHFVECQKRVVGFGHRRDKSGSLHGELFSFGDFFEAGNLQQAYVSNSRFRQRQTIYTTDLKAAKDAMATEVERKLAHELHEKLVKEWRVIEGLMAEGDEWQAVRQRVVAATQARKQTLKPGGMRYAA
jgi:hypothetical protein